MNLDVKIGTGAQATVYLYENNAIKVFRQGYNKASVFYEAMITSLIESTGLPIARIHEVLNINNNIAIKMDYIEGVTLHDCLLADIDNANIYIDIMVDLQVEVHSKNVKLPSNLKNRLKEKIVGNTDIDESKKYRLLKILERLPEGNSICHGDFHGFNIIKHDEKYYIIDWIDATNGYADADACRTYMLYLFHSPELAELYIETYCIKANKHKKDVLEWLPVIAAARLCDNIEGEKEKIFLLLENMMY